MLKLRAANPHDKVTGLPIDKSKIKFDFSNEAVRADNEKTITGQPIAKSTIQFAFCFKRYSHV